VAASSPRQCGGAPRLARSLPLVFVSKTQINAMIPFDLPVNATHQVIVTRGSTIE